MRALYPPIEAYDRGMLDVGDGQRVYWEVSGNPAGKPVVVLHGGPGAGSTPVQRRHFDPAAYRIVLFDQRGAGRSTPHVSAPGVDLAANTTWHLVADLERLREHLGVDRWQLFGGSWGATLAVAYAQTHPERVTEIILRGVFLLRGKELDWLYRGGAGALFPEAWAKFRALVPEGRDPLAAYQDMITSPDPGTRAAAASAWSNWEGAAVSLLPNPALVAQYAAATFAVPFARIALHYFTNLGWLAEDQLIRDAGALAGIPGRIVQGRYDVVCPPVTAWELSQAWPDARLTILPAGHAASDPGVLEALRDATDEFR
ncbi:prolyl aminopeptidase [Actinokineospora iranica]|uniref:Proline iminopeptidase n=1 Tax=Actinokineospora iranica TaxID=1271860 RepID=A0A1G6QYE5_9PSEU|nr:prolyl aminopeptidase [Actinokineospora iranica]SDC97352.1 prolyl aminopeptidase Serine peptidase. MEROPS family S33 [Actinokineospora iranica]